ncbi:MAG: hypothetical protein DRO40_04510 [Thermoprotei archaeon]|nr:MAG: hypothetical protein DRO40_04510 [Thermoprotei archaeon]
MPTVHLSLPEGVYRQLRKYAEYLGIQITDLIKVFISRGIDEMREKYGSNKAEELIATLNAVIESIEKLEKKITHLELRLKENEIKLREFVNSVDSRLSDLELAIQELNEPVLEPEIVAPRARKHRV